MKRNRFLRMVTLGIRQFRDPYYQGFAAQMSFYFLLAIVPIVILLSQLLGGVFHVELEDILMPMLERVDSPLLDRIGEFLIGSEWGERLFSSGIGLSTFIYIFIALWASSGAQFALMRITNFMFTEGRSTGKGYFRERFRAIFNMLLFLIIITLAIMILLFGGHVVELINGSMTVWNMVRWPVAFVLFFLLLTTNYYFMPSERIRIRQVVPGGLFASVGLVLVTMVYSRIMGFSTNAIVYGVLANIVAVMTWFYILSWVLCLGTLFNKVWMDTEQDKDLERHIIT